MASQPYPEQSNLHTKAPYRAALLTYPGNFQQALRDAKDDPTKTLFGVAQGIPSVFVTKIFASTKPDFIWLDVEHAMFDRLALHDAIHAAQHHSEGKSMVVVRVPKHDGTILSTALDAGASAIVIPHTESAEEVKHFIKEMYYPPIGGRSFSPWTFTPGVSDASLYANDALNMTSSNRHIAIIPQIESVKGLENIEEIAAVEGVSAMMFGPGDYSADAGLPLKLGGEPHPEFIAAMGKFVAGAAKYNRPLFGAAQSPEQIPMMIGMGYRALAVVFDVWGMAGMVDKGIKQARSYVQGDQAYERASSRLPADTMFDTLTTNAVELQRLLQDGKITSVEIVEQYQDQIDRYDSQVNAFISLAPRDVVLQNAASLDLERRQGKDCFVTEASLGMDTTVGTYAFIGAKPKKNGAIVQKLIDAGLIILGKTNMTASSQVTNFRWWLTVQELHGMKMIMTPGRSAAGGQTLSPYVGDIEKGEVILGHSSPGGSSTGSAVAIASGFSPLAMGAETTGSIVTPSARAALYALKPTVGIQDATRLYRMTDTFDSPGPMAKSPADLGCLTSILLDQKFESLATEAGHNAKIGFLSPKIWVLGPGMCRQHEGTAEQMIQDYEDRVSLLESKGFKIKYPAELPTAEALSLDGTDAIMPIAFSEFRDIGIPEFIQSFEECAVKDLAGLIKFNEANQEKALPLPDTDQELLIKALESTKSEERLEYLRTGLKEKARRIVDKALADQDLDLIAAPTDSALAIYTAAAGYPSGNVPLGQLKYNKRPFGLCLITRANEEERLLRFMVAYEVAVPPRPIPELNRV
ncbi:hypothetical protein SCUP515_06770 [Seiridium cupressi]